MNLLLPIIMILVSIGVFFGYTDRIYRGDSPDSIQNIQKDLVQYEEALNKSNKIIETRNVLQDRRASISEGSEDRLKKMVPDNVDNIQLIRDIEGIAQKYGLAIRNIGFDTASQSGGKTPNITSKSVGTATANSMRYNSLTFKFSTLAQYNVFITFMKDLEQSLRIIDVSSVSFSATDNGFYDFSVAFRTYWLK
ncbi:MAG: hypothetical protein WCW14_04720 [Candidatus Paceibacterota bacterium]